MTSVTAAFSATQDAELTAFWAGIATSPTRPLKNKAPACLTTMFALNASINEPLKRLVATKFPPSPATPWIKSLFHLKSDGMKIPLGVLPVVRAISSDASFSSSAPDQFPVAIAFIALTIE